MAISQKIFVLFLLLSSGLILSQPSAVTIVYPRSRFGDNIILYLKAKWFAHYHKLPFILVPFEHSDELVLYSAEKKGDPKALLKKYPHSQVIRGAEPANKSIIRDNGTIYIIDFTYIPKGWDHWMDLDKISNQSFKDQIRKLIAPACPQTDIDIPKNGITVALHVRKGGGVDAPLLSGSQTDDSSRSAFADKTWPLKFPPDQFYLQQLQTVFEMCGKQPLSVHIFTDDPNPESIAAQYSCILNTPNIHFSYRAQGNSHATNIIQDFIGLQQSDILIRPDSAFSIMAQFLGNHSLVIYPTHHYWEGNTLIVDQIGKQTKAINPS